MHDLNGGRAGEDAACSEPASWSFNDGAVLEAIELLQDMDVIAQLCTWRDAERQRLGRHAGGRPERFTPEALWVVMILAVRRDLPQHLTTYTDILFRRISPKMRTRLRLPDPPIANDNAAWEALERNVRTRFHSLLEGIDPSDLPKNRRLAPEAFQAAVARRRAERQLTDEILHVRHDRLSWVVNRILEASLRRLPRPIRRQWHGSAAVDATSVPAFADADNRVRGAKPRAKRLALVHSADPDGGYYVRTTNDEHHRGEKQVKARTWGYELSIVVSGSDDPDTDQPFPSLVVAMAPLHRPATAPGENAMTALTSLRDRGYPRGLLAGDRLYTNCRPETFQLPARSLGFGLVLDYKLDQLGIVESYASANMIEGAWYCPAMPDPLVNATIDYRNDLIEWYVWQIRIEERRADRLQPKARPDEQGHQRLMSPASPGAPSVGCEIKPPSIAATPTKPRIQLTEELRHQPPKICAQGSVTFPPEAGARYQQELHYGSKQWAKVYGTLRSTIEGMNGLLKDGAHAALGDPRRRRVRGVAAQSIFAALACMATNLRQIESFLLKALPDSAGVLRKRRPPRRKTKSLQDLGSAVLARSGDPPP